jgi:hypothetical protein
VLKNYSDDTINISKQLTTLMTDIICVTHRKSGNKNDYSDSEKIKLISADLPGFPADKNDWNSEKLTDCVIDAFLKCEVDLRDDRGMLLAKVSHSGVGGY